MSNSEEWIKNLLNDVDPKPFKPNWWYNEVGGIIEVLWKDTAYYAKWLNHDVTILIDMETEEVVGVNLWSAGPRLVYPLEKKIKEVEDGETQTETKAKKTEMPKTKQALPKSEG